MTSQQISAQIAAELRAAGQLPAPVTGEDRRPRPQARQARVQRAEKELRCQRRRAPWLAERW